MPQVSLPRSVLLEVFRMYFTDISYSYLKNQSNDLFNQRQQRKYLISVRNLFICVHLVTSKQIKTKYLLTVDFHFVLVAY